MFKKGDKVKCIRANNSPYELKLHNVYTINKIDQARGIVLDQHLSFGFSPSRFELVGKSPTVDQHTAGAKLDDGKLMAGLVLGGFSRALKGVAEVGTMGAKKYTPNGWQEVDNAFNRYHDAAIRHWLSYNSGEKLDPESGLSHLKHLAWNMLALVHFEPEHIDLSDTPLPEHPSMMVDKLKPGDMVEAIVSYDAIRNDNLTYNMGEVYQIKSIDGDRFTPVNHPNLSAKLSDFKLFQAKLVHFKPGDMVEAIVSYDAIRSTSDHDLVYNTGEVFQIKSICDSIDGNRFTPMDYIHLSAKLSDFKLSEAKNE